MALQGFPGPLWAPREQGRPGRLTPGWVCRCPGGHLHTGTGRRTGTDRHAGTGRHMGADGHTDGHVGTGQHAGTDWHTGWHVGTDWHTGRRAGTDRHVGTDRHAGTGWHVGTGQHVCADGHTHWHAGTGRQSVWSSGHSRTAAASRHVPTAASSAQPPARGPHCPSSAVSSPRAPLPRPPPHPLRPGAECCCCPPGVSGHRPPHQARASLWPWPLRTLAPERGRLGPGASPLSG